MYLVIMKNKKTISAVISVIAIIAFTLLRQCGYDVPDLGGMPETSTIDTISADTITTLSTSTLEADPIPAPRVVRDTVIHYREKIINTTDTLLKTEYVNRIINVGAGEIKRLNALIDSLKRAHDNAPVIENVDSVNEYAGTENVDGATLKYRHLIAGQLLKSSYLLEYPNTEITTTRARGNAFGAFVYGLNPINEIAPAAGAGIMYKRYIIQYDYTHAWKMHRVGVGFRIY